MAAIGELREYFAKLKREGSIRTDVPPKKEERYYNPTIETMPRDKIVEMRDERLRFILEWAYKYSPFYRELWDEAKVKPSDIKTFEDIQKLPFTRKAGKWGTRTDQLENPPYGKRTVKELLVPGHCIWSSTGTTGVSTHWVMTEDELEAMMEAWSRCWWASGNRPGMFHFFPLPAADRGYAIVFYIYEFLKRNLGMSWYYEGLPLLTSPKASAEKIVTLAKAYPDAFPLTLSSSSMAIQLGTYFKEYGYESPFTGTPCLMAETTTKSARKTILNLHPRMKGVQYSFTNSDGMVTYECEPSYMRFGELGHHITEDLQFIEVVDPETGKWVKEGERGELLTTCLFRLTMPLIRFSTEDVFVNEYATDVCECGRTHLRWMHPVPGRMMELFKVKGKELLPWDVEVVVVELPDATGSYQIIVTDWEMDELELHVETTRKLPDEEYEREIRRRLEERLGVPIKLSLHEIGTYTFRPTAYKVVKFVDKRPIDKMPPEMAPYKG
jgi:phenylacetate-coenzyme A ligase PaaK-like adenylate-forming protein